MGLENNHTGCGDGSNGSIVEKIPEREWNQADNMGLIVFEGYLLIIIAVFGTVGNVFTIVVLIQTAFKTSLVFIGLAVSDTLVTFSGIFVYGLSSISDYYAKDWKGYRKNYCAYLILVFFPILHIGKEIVNYLFVFLYIYLNLFSIYVFSFALRTHGLRLLHSSHLVGKTSRC